MTECLLGLRYSAAFKPNYSYIWRFRKTFTCYEGMDSIEEVNFLNPTLHIHSFLKLICCRTSLELKHLTDSPFLHFFQLPLSYSIKKDIPLSHPESQ